MNLASFKKALKSYYPYLFSSRSFSFPPRYQQRPPDFKNKKLYLPLLLLFLGILFIFIIYPALFKKPFLPVVGNLFHSPPKKIVKTIVEMKPLDATQENFLIRYKPVSHSILIGSPKAVLKNYQGDVISKIPLKETSNKTFEVNLALSSYSLKPGGYQIEVTYDNEIAVHNFAYGVLALNSHLDRYVPGETAVFDIGAVDNQGHTLCTADLLLEITTPAGQKENLPITPSGKCNNDNFIDVPDYTTSYPINQIGKYSLKLTNKDTGYVLDTFLESVDERPLKIERRGPSRINPRHIYRMEISLTAENDFEGTVTEPLSADFKIDSTTFQKVKDNPALLSANITLKANETKTLIYQFDTPDISPALFTTGPLTFISENQRLDQRSSALFAEQRVWQIASDAIDVSGLIIPWPGDHSAIPSGWTRITDWDTEYLEGKSSGTLSSNLGQTTHTHTSPSHTHTANHSHTGNTGTADGTGVDTGTVVANSAPDGHTHTTTINEASHSNNSASANLNATSNDPPYQKVVWVQANAGTNDIPSNAYIFYNSNTLPSNFNRFATGRFLKGADGSSGNGGGTGGSSNAHTHTDAGHTHTENSHTHTATIGNVVESAKNNDAKSTTIARLSDQSHSVSGGNVTAAESGQSVTDTLLNNSDAQPPFYTINILKNETGGATTPVNTIGIWNGAYDDIPANWFPCDGTNGTPDLNGRFLKGAQNDGSDLGTTGGALTHSHTANASHTHNIDSHTHTFTVGNDTSGGVGNKLSGALASPPTHSHTFSVTQTGGTTGSQTITASDNTSGTNKPPYDEVFFIQYQPTITISGTSNATSGTVAVAVDGSIQTDKTGTIQGDGTWTITDVHEPDPDQIITVFVDTTTAADKSTAIAKYNGTDNVTGMVLTKTVLTLGYTSSTKSLNYTELNSYDWDSENKVIYQMSGSTLDITKTDASNSLSILSGYTLTQGASEILTTHDFTNAGTFTAGSSGVINISGSYTNSGTYTKSTETINFTSTTTETVNTGGTGATKDLYNTVFSGSGGQWTITSNAFKANQITSTNGTISGTQNISTAGLICGASCGYINMTGGISNISGTSNFGTTSLSSNWTFYTLAIIGTITAQGNGTITITNSLYIANGFTLNAGSKTYSLINYSSTTFQKDGTFNADLSTISYDYVGINAASVTAATYYNLKFNPASGTPTYTMGAGTYTINNDLTTNGAGNEVVDATAADTLAVTGNFTVGSGDEFKAPLTGKTFTVTGNFDNNGTFTPGTGTVTFNKTSSTQTVDIGVSSFNNLIHAGAGTLQISTNTLDVDGDFSQTLGTFDANSQNQEFAGDFSLSDSTSFTSGGTLTFDGSGTKTVTDSNTVTKQNLGAVVINGSSKIINLGSSIKTTSVNVASGQTLGLASSGYILEITGTGTAGSRPFIVAGTLNEGTNSTVKFTGYSANIDIQPETYFNLTLAPSDTGGPTYTLGTATSQAFVISGDLTIGDGVNAITVTGNTYDPTIDVNGSVEIKGSAILTAPSSNTANAFTVYTNWANNGTFNHSSGRVTFDGANQTFAGSSVTTFFQLFLTGATSRIVTFTDGVTVAVDNNGILTFTGAESNLLTLQNSSTADWNLQVSVTGTTVSVSYVAVTHSNAGGYKEIDASNGTNVNNDFNTNWLFASPTPTPTATPTSTPTPSPTPGAPGSSSMKFNGVKLNGIKIW